MKKIALTFTAVILSAAVANAFPETSSFNTTQMQQIQHLQYTQSGEYDNVQNFKERKQVRQERSKKLEERQQKLEQRASQPVATPNVQFVNDNGVLKIERQ